MENHEIRVLEERRELNIKIEALKSFMGTTTWDLLHVNDQNRLIKQASIMLDYEAILTERIKYFD